MATLLFVDSAGRTRSPLAAGLFVKLAREASLDGWVCEPVGIHAHHGQMIAAEVCTVLSEAGAEPLKIGVEELTPKLAKMADLILCMTSNIEDEVMKKFIASRNKCKTLMSVLRQDTDVFDPNKLGEEKFRECLSMMRPAIEELVERLKG